MSFRAIFIAGFTVENLTDKAIVITPVGTYGKEGQRGPLPVTMSWFPYLPAFQGGGFRLPAGGTVTICYDWDDVNFSEIVVEDEQARQFQMVTDPNPTTNQYHAPSQERCAIDDLARLGEVVPAVRDAAEAAQRQLTGATRFYALLFGPWLIYGVLCYWMRRLSGRYLTAQVHSPRCLTK
jgi:hypothetical protein